MAATSRQKSAQHRDSPDIVIITGMSGSGRTQALHVFEDMGYFCIDNLPTSLILQLARLVGINSGVARHLAVTCDLRSQELFGDLTDALQELSEHELSWHVLFLEAQDEVILRRYSENRRPHPLAQEGLSLSDTIAYERTELAHLRGQAQTIIDTSTLRPSELRTRIRRLFSALTDQQLLDVQVFSFGFKHGVPRDADLVIDVRFLPNPFYVEDLRSRTGNDSQVKDYVLSHEAAQNFLEAWTDLLDVVMPGYVSEGKSRVSIAIGCTGGQHRSVVIANETARHLSEKGFHVACTHRDIMRNQAAHL